MIKRFQSKIFDFIITVIGVGILINLLSDLVLGWINRTLDLSLLIPRFVIFVICIIILFGFNLYKNSSEKIIYGYLVLDEEHQIVISKLTFTLGRSNKCDYVIPATCTWVGNEHARIDINDKNEIVLTDLKSQNGTFINQTRLEPNQASQLITNDCIALGSDQKSLKAWQVTFVVGEISTERKEPEVDDNENRSSNRER